MVRRLEALKKLRMGSCNATRQRKQTRIRTVLSSLRICPQVSIITLECSGLLTRLPSESRLHPVASAAPDPAATGISPPGSVEYPATGTGASINTIEQVLSRQTRAMAEVGGMLAPAVIKVVIKQIGSAIGGEIKLHWNMKKDLEKMKMTLESVEAVLSDAERRSLTENSSLMWLKRLKDAMHDISDMLDDFQADTGLVHGHNTQMGPETAIMLAIAMNQQRIKS
ncbi:hypothetical protein ACQ4PT_031275 [Festuca glaucescens]